MKKHIFSFILAPIFLLLSISASVEIFNILKTFSITSRVELFFFIGFCVYLVIHFLFYKPVFIHVMSHEFTHMIWASLFGGKTKHLSVSAEGGKVVVSKSNFLISLAPYFFPLYALVFAGIFFIAQDVYRPYIAFFIGAGLSFHIALTLYSLRQIQSDLYEDSNIIFSYIFIYFMNLLMAAIILAIMSPTIEIWPIILKILKGSYMLVIDLFKLISGFFSSK